MAMNDNASPHPTSGDARDAHAPAVASGLHDTADTARELAQTLERGASALDKAGSTAESVTRKAEQVADRAEAARDMMTRRVREHPMAAVAAALVVGFVAARAGD
ncbi:MAG TPA: hypothetical protein VHB25_21330 [Gemmatimonadaceae bacterium]|nr:hypothetical protein [Gemmatimonadaceae bacterium]